VAIEVLRHSTVPPVGMGTVSGPKKGGVPSRMWWELAERDLQGW
jgi:hypothetical protein